MFVIVTMNGVNSLVGAFLRFLIVTVSLSYAQDNLDSPCPGVFQYQYDNNRNDIYGLISVPVSSEITNAIKLDVQFSVGNSIQGFTGNIELLNPKSQVISDIQNGKPLQYRLHFPRWIKILPRITRISVNGNQLCYGYPIDKRLVALVTTVSLQHTLTVSAPFWTRGSGGGTRLTPSNNNNNNWNSLPTLSFSDGDDFGTPHINVEFLTETPPPTKNVQAPSIFNSNPRPPHDPAKIYPRNPFLNHNDNNRYDQNEERYHLGNSFFQNSRPTSQWAFNGGGSGGGGGDNGGSFVPFTNNNGGGGGAGNGNAFNTYNGGGNGNTHIFNPFADGGGSRNNFNPYANGGGNNGHEGGGNANGGSSGNGVSNANGGSSNANNNFNPFNNGGSTDAFHHHNPYNQFFGSGGLSSTQSPNHIPTLVPKDSEVEDLPTVESNLVKKSPPNTDNDACGTAVVTNALLIQGDKIRKGIHPWLAAVFMQNSEGGLIFMCGSSLISHKHVVTAAHCVQKKKRKLRPEELWVVLGRQNIQRWSGDDAKIIQADQTHVHPDHKASTADADIAVIVLAEELSFVSLIKPVCLWTGDGDIDLIVERTGTVVGWGKDESGKVSPEPKQIQFPVVSEETCLRSNPGFDRITSNRTFCAGSRNNSGPCNGDSGGGFLMLRDGRWYLRGVVSMSLLGPDGNCDLSQYVVFTDVAKYVDWILSIIN